MAETEALAELTTAVGAVGIMYTALQVMEFGDI